jgi:formylglycine-generating enzyme required for sulfatase activity
MATDDDIKAAYRRLVKSVHPDSNQPSGADDGALKNLNEAYSVLRDVKKRAVYDAIQSPNLPATVSQESSDDPFRDIRVSPSDYYFHDDSKRASRKKSYKWPVISVALGLAALGAIAVFVIFSSSAPKNFHPGMVFSDCHECPNMVVLPAGSFVMGLSVDAAGQFVSMSPPHLVSIARPIAVGQLLITNAEYAEFLSAEIQRGQYDQRWAETDQDWNGSHLLWRIHEVLSESGYQTHPVTHVSWAGAKSYVAWLSLKTGQHYRLPSEAEWEYAARAGTQTKFYFGDDVRQVCEYGNVPDLTRQQRHPDWAAVVCTDGYSETAPVGKFKPNAFGLYDMIGNVWEWVEDCWHNGYDGAPTDGSPWLSGGDCGSRVVRGQSYDYLNPQAGVATRLASAAYGRLPTTGFRIVRDIGP